MTSLKFITLTIIVALLALQPITLTASALQMQVPGPGHMGPPTRDDEGSVWVNTDIITIMANEGIPMFHYWYANDENGTYAKFMAQYVSIIEFEDANGDAAYQTSEILNFAPLAAYEWTVQTGTETSENGTITELWLKYTKGGSIMGNMMGGMPQMPRQLPGHNSIAEYEDVTLQIWAHLYLDDYQGEVSNDSGVHATYTVSGSAELKMDIEIGNFPFSSNTSSVAIEVLLKEDVDGTMHQHMFRTREQTRNVTANSHMNWSTPSGNETMFQRMNQTHTQRIDMINAEGNTPEGFFSWLDVATVTWPGGATEVVNVSASYVVTNAGLSVYLAYPHFDGGSLLHDPSIGVYEDAAPITIEEPDYLLFLGIGIVAVLVIIAAITRKR